MYSIQRVGMAGGPFSSIVYSPDDVWRRIDACPEEDGESSPRGVGLPKKIVLFFFFFRKNYLKNKPKITPKSTCVRVDRTAVIIIRAITAAAAAATVVNEHAAGSDGSRTAHEPAGKTGDDGDGGGSGGGGYFGSWRPEGVLGGEEDRSRIPRQQEVLHADSEIVGRRQSRQSRPLPFVVRPSARSGTHVRRSGA